MLCHLESAVPIQRCVGTDILKKLYVLYTDAWTFVAYVSIKKEQG